MKTVKKAKTTLSGPQARLPKDRTIIRAFSPTDSEYADIVAIENANYPDALMGVNEFRFYDQTSGDQYMHERLVAERNDRIVGFVTYGQPWWSFQAGKYFFWLAVDPDWQHTAVANELYAAMLKDLQPHKPRLLTCEIREDQGYVIDLLQKRGFAAQQRNPMSALEVLAFEPERYAALQERVRQAGISISDLNEVAAQDPDWAPKVWDLEWQILQDVPSPDPLTQATFEEWRVRTFDSPNFIAGGYLVARDGERYVGMSSLWKSEADQEKLGTGLTGVLPEYRRRGIATALKVAGLNFARAYGAKIVETDNEENNPMFELNKQLGFKEKPAFVMYALELRPVEGAEAVQKENP